MVDTSDIVTEQAIQDVVRGYIEEDLVYRQAFDTMNIADTPNDTVEFPVEQDNMGEPQKIPENAEFPRDEEDIDTITVTVDKYGFEVPISREAQQDAVFDVVARQTNKKARKMAELLNRLAYEEMSNNLHPNSPYDDGGSTSGEMDFTDIVKAREVLLDDGYNPTTLIVTPEAESDLLTSEEFVRATEMGDDTIMDAQIGRVAGLDVLRSNAGLMSGSTGHMVDPTEYGREVVKEAVSTNEYMEDSRHADVFQTWTRRSYKTVDPSAALRVDG